MATETKNKVIYNPFAAYKAKRYHFSPTEESPFQNPENMVEAAWLTADQTGRLQRFMQRARAGENVTVLSLGGSITEGSGASPGEYYIDNLSRWFEKHFPQKNVSCINVGRGTTTSLFGSARIERDLLPLSPDLVIVEYAVNDIILDDYVAQRAFEGVLRKILSLPTSPAVLVLFCCCGNFASAEEYELPLVRHYGLPASSFLSAMGFEMERTMGKEVARNLDDEAAEEWAVKHYIFDGCHPNTPGYYLLTDMITTHLLMAEKNPVEEGWKLPDPLVSDVFVSNHILDNRHLTVTENTGWEPSDRMTPYEEHAFVCRTPGASIRFSLPPCRIVTLVTRRSIKATAGVAKVEIDGNCFDLDAFFAGGWGTHNNYRVIVDEETPKERTLKLTFTGQKSPETLAYAEKQGISEEEAAGKFILSELHLA